MNKVLMEVKMYLGLNLPKGGVVYEAEFRDWLHEVVDPLFEGYTITEAEGRWKGESENSYVLTFIVTEVMQLANVMNCAEIYKDWFGQDSVLVTRQAFEGVVFV